jgi:hypothetical protein
LGQDKYRKGKTITSIGRPNSARKSAYSKQSSKKQAKQKYQLKEGEEELGYEWKDGKRYRKIKRIIKQEKLLSIEEYNEICDAFNLFDKDGSNTIDVGELRDALKVLGIHMNINEVKELMEKADKDGSGTIDLEEFVPLMASKFEARN